MADGDNNTNANNNGSQTGTQPGNQGGNTGNQGQATPFDTSKLSDADISKVLEDQRLWNTPRLKELTEAKKKLGTIEEQNRAAEEQKLKEANDYKTLAEKKDEEINNLKTQVQQSIVNNQLLMEFGKVGFIDSDAALKLIDRSLIKINDDGTVTGVAEAVEALKTKSPYLVGNGTTQRVGSSTGNPANQQQGVPRFKHSQLKDPAFYREHEAEIAQAMKLGTIENDL